MRFGSLNWLKLGLDSLGFPKGAPSGYIAALKFNDKRNSQYVGQVV